MSEESKPFLKACVIITWIVPVIGFLTLGFVFWSLVMKTTGMGEFADRLIYPAAYCWMILPVIGLLAGYRPFKLGPRNVKILMAFPLVVNGIYFGFAIYLALGLIFDKI